MCTGPHPTRCRSKQPSSSKAASGGVGSSGGSSGNPLRAKRFRPTATSATSSTSSCALQRSELLHAAAARSAGGQGRHFANHVTAPVPGRLAQAQARTSPPLNITTSPTASTPSTSSALTTARTATSSRPPTPVLHLEQLAARAIAQQLLLRT